jgi:hypothetical protein
MALRHTDHRHDESAQYKEYVNPERASCVPRAKTQACVSLNNTQRSNRAKDLEIRETPLRWFNSG